MTTRSPLYCTYCGNEVGRLPRCEVCGRSNEFLLGLSPAELWWTSTGAPDPGSSAAPPLEESTEALDTATTAGRGRGRVDPEETVAFEPTRVVLRPVTGGADRVLEPGLTVLGSVPHPRRSSLVIGSEGVAPLHTVLRVRPRADGGVEVSIADGGSTEGTYLNGRRLPARETRPLVHGDRISLAGSEWELRRVSGHGTETAPSLD